MHQHYLTPVQTHQQSNMPPSPYDRSGIYKLTCMTCNKSCGGQTSWNLRQRYKQHIRYIKNNNPQSAYALHILNNQHEYGPIEKTMTLLKPLKNTSLLTPYEQFFIQAFHKYGTLFPYRTPANPTHYSRWPSTPPTLLHDPASRTVTFTVPAPYNATPHKCNQPHPALPGM